MATTPAFRLGLAGAGRMGRTHMRALAGSDAVTITAVAEPFEQSREQVAAQGLDVYASVGEMLDKAHVDGVLICAPTDRHGQVIAEVAAAELPILCEKPCGLTSAQTREAAQVAKSARVPLQIAYWRRYVPELRALKDRMAAGDLGLIHLVCCYQWDEAPPAAAFRAHSGGIFVDMGVHEFDQIRWLSGLEIGALSVAAVPESADLSWRADGAPASAARPDMDSAQAIVQLSGQPAEPIGSAGSAGSAGPANPGRPTSAVGFVSLGRYHPAGDMVRAEVFGTAGTVRCDVIRPEDGERAQLEALRKQAEDFAMLARGGTSTGATAADAIAALDAAERASAAIRGLAASHD